MSNLRKVSLGLIITLACLLPPVLAVLHHRDLNGPLLPSYHYIVCGCGASGLVVATRLSENPLINVLCIEAGQPDQGEDVVLYPVYVGTDIGGIYDWNLATTPQTQLDGAVRPMPQGKALGGGTIINAMVWNRGGQDDYNAWEALGNTGWGWESILPYFIKSERFTPYPDASVAAEYHISYDPSVHGFDGPVNVSYPHFLYPQSINLFEGLSQLGVPIEYDEAQGSQAGGVLVPTDLDPTMQTRCDARRSYYDPNAGRPNLHVITGQHVTRLIIEGVSTDQVTEDPTTGGSPDGNGAATNNNGNLGFGSNTTPPSMARRDASSSNLRILGVEYASSASAPRQTVYATKEVIVATGSLHTTQLMQVSGIGPASLLQALNITVALNLPGVGNNLQDHCLVGTFYPYNNASYPLPTWLNSNATYNALAEQEYLSDSEGPWTAGAYNALAFPSLTSISNNTFLIVTNATDQGATDYLIPGLNPTIVAGFAAQKANLVQRLGSPNSAAYEIINNNAGSLTVSVMHPLSRGVCYINSPDPFQPPVIDPRWLSNPVDRSILHEALAFNELLLATPPMQLLQPAQFSPPVGADISTIDAFINNGIRTEFHPSGTMSMLPLDQGGCVNPRLLVYGTQNLRVVDASIMPLVPAAHLQSVVYAVAEKAADMIKVDNLPDGPVPMSTSISVVAPTTPATTVSINLSAIFGVSVTSTAAATAIPTSASLSTAAPSSTSGSDQAEIAFFITWLLQFFHLI